MADAALARRARAAAVAEAWATAAEELEAAVRAADTARGQQLGRDLRRLIAVWDNRHSAAAAGAAPRPTPDRPPATVVPMWPIPRSMPTATPTTADDPFGLPE